MNQECSGGECVEISTEEYIDTDYGMDFLTPGAIYLNSSGSLTLLSYDHCQGPFIKEYYLHNTTTYLVSPRTCSSLYGSDYECLELYDDEIGQNLGYCGIYCTSASDCSSGSCNREDNVCN
ncbi:hypothetical protein HN385_03155 [archaeon]|jgi:hypothetical protein|nr:hypothetical protein [archaeon]MBT3450813.1 hypothetical protein [archaeon]MBT6868478.1 hypothetical protein [archaeon]MBT7193577.1 hypothetical protein [archaeon]MBT7381228.1 hypothetical protein [archaeon]